MAKAKKTTEKTKDEQVCDLCGKTFTGEKHKVNESSDVLVHCGCGHQK